VASSGALGGVADSTHDVLAVVEAAGHDVVLVETVGTGQSETAVADLVDTFLLVTVTGTGDQLQAIKMGVLEWADVVAVTKADGANVAAARSTARELGAALRQAHRQPGDPAPTVLTCSAIEDTGIAELWAALRDHHDCSRASGALERRRRQRRVARLRAGVRDELLRSLPDDAAMRAVEEEVRRGSRTIHEGVDLIMDAVRRRLAREVSHQDAG
jgi:LAO/AO transport system kinase